jgi:hypothetical protein
VREEDWGKHRGSSGILLTAQLDWLHFRDRR